MTIQTLIDGAQNIARSRSASIDFTRTFSGVVKRSRSGPFLTSFEITPSYPDFVEHDALAAQIQNDLNGPYSVSIPTFGVRTNGSYVPSASPLGRVLGGGQTGNSIVIDGYATSATGVLAAGDFIQFTGVPYTYVVLQDADSNATGEMTVVLDMPIADSPSDNSIVRVGTEIQWNMTIDQFPIEQGLGRLPFNASYGNTLILREAR